MRSRLVLVVALFVLAVAPAAPAQAQMIQRTPHDLAGALAPLSGLAGAQAVPACRRQHIPPVLAGSLDPSADYPPFPQEGPCYYEIGLPPSGTPVRGAMLMVGGGGFYSSPNMIKSVPAPASPNAQVFKLVAQRWNSYGWITYAVEHSPQGAGMFDVRAFFDMLRGYFDAQPGYGPNFPVCAWGGSSGGHFALMVALMRPRLSCVVTEAAPTRLDQTTGVLRNIIDWAFTGIGLPLPAFSPGDPGRPSPPNLTMPMLLGHYRHDPLVPLAQGSGFAASHPSAALWIVENGTPTCVEHAVRDEACLFTTHRGPAMLSLSSHSMAEWRCREARLPAVPVGGTPCLALAPPGEQSPLTSPPR